MLQQNPAFRRPESLRRNHILVVFHAHHGTAGDAGNGGPAEDAQHKHHSHNGALFFEHLHHDDGGQHKRNGKENVSNAGQHRIKETANVACEGTDQRTNNHHQQGGEHANGHGGTSTIDGARVNVTALTIKAKRMARLGTFQLLPQHAHTGFHGGEPLRHKCEEQRNEDQGGGDPEQGAATQVTPCLTPH